MIVYDPLATTLLYGPPGSGKTALAVSSFWDWKKKVEVANGKLITFGSEDNPALGVPQSCRETAKGTSLRLTSPFLDSQKFVEDFDKITRRFIADNDEGHPLDVLVIDGWSEFDLLFEESYPDNDGDNYAKWNALLSQMFSSMVRLTTDVIGCPVIATARVMEKKKARSTGRSGATPGDPDYMTFDYYPAMRGQFRLHFPHYYNLVLYMETMTGKRDDVVVPVHVANMVRAKGDFYVKNVWEHEWLAAGHPHAVANKMWPELWSMLTSASTNYVDVGVAEAVVVEDDEEDKNEGDE